MALFDVVRVNPSLLVAGVEPRSVRLLRHIGRGSRVKASVLKKTGAPFLGARLRRRKGFVLGFLLFPAALYLLSSRVWFVHVEGARRLPASAVLEVAREAGLVPGVPRSTVDRRRVARELLLTLPRLSWAAVEMRGTLAVVRVVEREVPDPATLGPAHVVAARGGKVEKLIPFRGTPRVTVGDRVRPGQLLIEGTPTLRADGIVRARVRYEEAVVLPLVERVQRPTGRRHTATRLWVGRWRLGGATTAPPFPHYRLERQVRPVTLQGVELPVRKEDLIYHELQPVVVRRDYEAARREAEARAREALRARLPQGAAEEVTWSVEAQRVELDGGPAARVVVTAEREEDIRAFQRIGTEGAGGERQVDT